MAGLSKSAKANGPGVEYFITHQHSGISLANVQNTTYPTWAERKLTIIIKTLVNLIRKSEDIQLAI